MKKIVLFVLLSAFLTACSQYTCPTYSKKDTPKPGAAPERLI